MQQLLRHAALILLSLQQATTTTAYVDTSAMQAECFARTTAAQLTMCIRFACVSPAAAERAQRRKNTTRLCQYSVTEECVARTSPDDCAAEIIANLTASNRAAAAAAGSNTVSSVAIAVPVALGGEQA